VSVSLKLLHNSNLSQILISGMPVVEASLTLSFPFSIPVLEW